MGDISAILPQDSDTVKAIYEYHKKLGDAEPKRGYLGASIIGHECERFLWYMFRGCVREKFDGRMHRLFETGHLEEARFVRELRGIGCTVHEVDPNTKEQIEVTAFGGHFKGHMDGVGLGVLEAPKTWHVLEFKTHNDASFEKLKNNGVKDSKPQHYAQMQIEMGLASLTRALYLARNKNTDELYSERIEYSASDYKALLAKAERVIFSMEPCLRMAKRSDDFRCTYCPAKDLCWGTGAVALPIPEKTCRTCCHATPEKDGSWSCNAMDKMEPCKKHLVLPGLLASFCEPRDASQDWIEFSNFSDKAVWRHGTGEDGTWMTEELMKSPAAMVGNAAVIAAKKGFGATVTRVDNSPEITTPESLVDRYPPEDSRLLWHGPESEIENALIEQGIEPSTEPTSIFKDEKHRSFEYQTKEADLLLVLYEGTDVAAIWEGIR